VRIPFMDAVLNCIPQVLHGDVGVQLPWEGLRSLRRASSHLPVHTIVVAGWHPKSQLRNCCSDCGESGLAAAVVEFN